MVVITERKDDVLLVTLNDVARRNAFTRSMVKELMGLNCDVETIIITNSGPTFSAGLDLRELVGPYEDVKGYLRSVHELVRRIVDCDAKIAMVLKGDAYGFGVEFTYFADLVVASREDIKLSLQGVILGVLPPYTLALGHELLGYNAVRVLLSAPLDARQAQSLGLVHAIGDLDPATVMFRVPRHVRGRVSARRALAVTIDRALEVLEELALIVRDTPTRQLIERFLEKRRPTSQSG